MSQGPLRYRYRMRSTGYSSRKYGPCEICGEHCSEVFCQTEEAEYADREGFTQYGCRTHFGHEACLRAKQRRGTQQ